jgi:hypothetical protein
VADANSLMMIVYQGNNYQIRVGDLLSVAGVPTSTQVIAGTGMTGGGQLTGNVTLSIANAGVGSTQLNTTGVTAGVYGNATNIPVFTVDSTGRVTAATTIPATISGYVPTSTQVIAGNGLTGGGALNSNVTLAASYSATLPSAGFQSGSVGAANTLARSDHKHPAVDLSADDQVDNLLGLSNGGTARSLVAAAGAIIWSGADGLYVGPVGLAGQVLVSGGTGAPTWGSALIVSDQAANVVYAGPAAGAAAPTAFRSLVNADLPASGVAANTYGSTTAIPVITVNAKGVITSATTASFTGGLSYQGSWNASTNTPTLTSSVGVNGYYYIVSVAGSTNLNGVTDWQVGDWAIFNGSTWQKIDQTNLVSSVNGQVGVVSIAYADLAGTIPTWNQNTTGTAANVTGTVAILNGGTGQTTASAAFNALSPITTTGDLILGTGVNTASRLAIGANGYLLSSNGTTASWQPAPAAGVTTFAGGTTGLTPASATSGAITLAGTLAVANGGTGVTTSTGSGNVVLSTSPSLTTPTQVTYENWTPISAPTYAEGRFWYDSTIKALTYNNDISGNSLHIGQETQLKVRNGTGSTIAKGAPVYITSTSSGQTFPNVALAQANTLTTGNAIGLTNEAIASGADGYVVINGLLNGLNTGTFTVGDILYVSPYSAGQLMNTFPPTGYPVQIGVVSFVNSSTGSIYINQSNAFVQASSVVGTLAIANGGTNSTATATAGGSAYGTGTAYAFTAAGTAGQVLTSTGTGAPAFGGISGGTF